MASVAVVLSGCGVYDGAEIYESVLTLLRLAQQGAQVQAFAPDVDQMHVIDHLRGEPVAGETRNVLREAARIVRGDILPLDQASAADFDALILPGGFGAAKNLSDFAVQGAQCQVEPTLLAFARQMHQARKPIGLICIAPALAAAICGEGVRCTIGNDADTAASLQAMGAEHVDCGVGQICVDDRHLLVTTPAYMLAESILQAAEGINQLVDKVLELA